jgi:hypothetical protein
MALVLGCLALSACGITVPVKHTEVEQQIPEQASQLVAGETDRATVRARLGEPWFTASDWNVEVFRATGSDVALPVMFVLWWPVPLGVSVDTSTVYVLVRYDDRGLVADAAHAVAMDPSFFNDDYARSDSDAMIRLDPLRFSAGADGEGGLLSIDSDPAAAVLAAHPPQGTCRVLLGCTSWQLACATRVSVDGDSKPPIARTAAAFERLESFHHALVPVEVPPGTHELRLTPLSGLVDYEASTKFTCVAGQTMYGLLDLQPHEEKGFLRVRLTGSLRVTDAMPDAFAGRRLMLWHGGRWLVH